MTAPYDPYRRDDEQYRGATYGGPPNHEPYDPRRSGNIYGQPPQQPGWQSAPQPAYGQPAYGAPPPKKAGAGKIIGIIAASLVGVCVLAGIVGAISGGTDDKTTLVDTAKSSSQAPATAPADDAQQPAAEPTEAEAATDDITYKVTGGGSAMISYMDGNFQISQVTEPLPWSTTVDGPSVVGQNMNAQRKSGDNGTITCQIFRGDEMLTENTSSGPYAVVSCLIN
ncbi:MmpS family transport accessory protein [Cryptosporangium sp. NPDC048952]|uniref:MmpS family transport accessory protein n=1 Tax=Cryptosporangium sp. NPDC048952 TaxID=3363961 RepID=UPI0037231D58